MAMIVAAAVFLNGALRYPGFWALLPCVGAGLVIGANGDTPSLTSRWLASPPCVAIGRMSYSIYLWHWPIITYCRLSGIPIDSLPVQLSIAVATLGCSYLSWKFVEVQFRNSAIGSVRLRLAGLASAAFALGTISATVMLTDGLPSRLDAPTRALLAYQNYPASALYREGECFLRLRQPATDFHEARCADRVSGRATLLLWGDSHAAHLAPGLREASTKFGINIVQATYAGCAPIPSRSSNSGECANFGKNILKLALTEKFDAIVLSANWTGYPSILPELLTVISELVRNQRFVIVIGPTAEFNNPLPLLLAGKRKGTTPIPFSPPGWLSDTAVELDRRMGEMFGELPNVAYLSPISEVCPSRVCPVLLDNNVPLVWDSSHLTAEGSRLVSNLLLNRISSVIRPAAPSAGADQFVTCRSLLLPAADRRASRRSMPNQSALPCSSKASTARPAVRRWSIPASTSAANRSFAHRRTLSVASWNEIELLVLGNCMLRKAERKPALKVSDGTISIRIELQSQFQATCRVLPRRAWCGDLDRGSGRHHRAWDRASGIHAAMR